ncbi:hypothetical protein L195_g031208, partial [Trifolium pratense]
SHPRESISTEPSSLESIPKPLELLKGLTILDSSQNSKSPSIKPYNPVLTSEPKLKLLKNLIDNDVRRLIKLKKDHFILPQVLKEGMEAIKSSLWKKQRKGCYEV